MIPHLQHVWLHIKSVGEVWLMAMSTKAMDPVRCLWIVKECLQKYVLSLSLVFSLFLSISLSCSLCLALKLKRNPQMQPSCPESRRQSCRRALWHQSQSLESRWRVSFRNACHNMETKTWQGVGFGRINLASIHAHPILDNLGPNARASQCLRRSKLLK